MFLDDFTELETYNEEEDAAIPFPNDVSVLAAIDKWKECSMRLKNLIGFIQCMLESKYSVAKNIQPNIILDLITRGLTIHKCISNDIDEIFLSDLSIKLHIKLLKLLGTVIVW